jgi:hypothetical protein
MAKIGLSIKRKRTPLIPSILLRFFEILIFQERRTFAGMNFQKMHPRQDMVQCTTCFGAGGVVVSGKSISRCCLDTRIEV